MMSVHGADDGSPSRRGKLPRTAVILFLSCIVRVCHQRLEITDVVGGSTQRLHLRIKQHIVIIHLVNFHVEQPDIEDNVNTNVQKKARVGYNTQSMQTTA